MKLINEFIKLYIFNKISAFFATLFKTWNIGLIQKLSEFVTFFFSSFVTFLFLIFGLFFLSLAGLVALNELLNNQYIGFLIVGALYIIFAFLIFRFRKHLFKRFVAKNLKKTFDFSSIAEDELKDE